MRFRVYGVDAASQAPRDPLVVDAGTADEARGRAVAQGMAVRAVIADAAPSPPDAEPPPGEEEAPPDPMPGLRRFVLFVLVPLAVLFFLVHVGVRAIVQAATWTTVWGLGLFAGGGLAGLLGWLSRGSLGLDVAWPIGLAIGITAASAVHGARAGWRWWWAKRSLSPLAAALGMTPEDADSEDPSDLRVPVLLAQTLAGAVLGTLGALAGWATGWHPLVIGVWTIGGGLGLAAEGAILGTQILRRRPVPPPGAAVAGPYFESLGGLLTRLLPGPRAGRGQVLGYALDRAGPGAAAGTMAGLLAVLLTWWAF
jgi:hypothetical protein